MQPIKIQSFVPINPTNPKILNTYFPNTYIFFWLGVNINFEVFILSEATISVHPEVTNMYILMLISLFWSGNDHKSLIFISICQLVYQTISLCRQISPIDSIS